MTMTRSALTQDDIRTLVRGATPDERAAAAVKLCQAVDRPGLSETERAEAADILRIMAADASELVRRALAVTLRSSPLIPREVANALARDLDAIALPLLNFSPVFTDEDLVEIVRLGRPVTHLAIAKRPTVSASVSAALIKHGEEAAVAAVCGNENATIADEMLQRAMERFEKSEAVLAALAYRQVLPLSVTERLITLVSDELRQHIARRHKLPPSLLAEITTGAAERATLDLVDQAGRASDVKAFAAHLSREGRLTPSLLLRALAHGHMTFFEYGLAELAGVPHHRAWLMVHDAGALGLRAIYDRAGLPARLYAAFRSGVDAFHSLEFDDVLEGEDLQSRMLERFLTHPQTAPAQDMDYLLDKLDRLTPPRSRPPAGSALQTEDNSVFLV